MRFNDRMTSCMCRVDGLPRGAEQGKTDLHVEPACYAPLQVPSAMDPTNTTRRLRSMQNSHQGVRT